MIFAHIPIGYFESKLFIKTEKKNWKEILAFAFGNILPDLDLAIVFLANFFEKDVGNHRSFITHTPIFWIFLFLIFSITLKFFKIENKKKIFLKKLMKIFLIGSLTHLFCDTIITTIGIRWFFPFSNEYFEIPLKSDSLINSNWTGFYFKYLFWIEVFIFILFVFSISFKILKNKFLKK